MAQKRIDSAIASKLDQFFDLAEYDWTPEAVREGGQQASFLQDMLDWLTTMMESVLTLLPRETKQMAYRTAFQHMADQLWVSAAPTLLGCSVLLHELTTT